jgi:hypothetical protein
VSKRKLSDTLNLVTDPHTPAAKNTFVGISLKKRGSIIHRERDPFPRVSRLFDPVFVDESLEHTFSFFFTSGTNHGVVEEDQLELKPSRFDDLRRVGDDLHSLFCRSETGGKEFRFPFLLDDAETAGPEGNEPWIVTEGGDSYASGLSRLEDRPASLNHYLCPVDGKLDYVRHCSFFCHAELVSASGLEVAT